jgi:hypothetical protein
LFGDSVEVLPCDGLYVGVSPTPVAEVFPHGEEGLRGHPLDRPPTGVALVEQVWVAGEFVEEVGIVEGEDAFAGSVAPIGPVLRRRLRTVGPGVVVIERLVASFYFVSAPHS